MIETNDDIHTAATALSLWCESQQLSPYEACAVMGFLIAGILGSTPDRESARKNFDWALTKTMEQIK